MNKEYKQYLQTVVASINVNVQTLLQPEIKKKKENGSPHCHQIGRKNPNMLNFYPHVSVLPSVLRLYPCRQIRCTSLPSKIS